MSVLITGGAGYIGGYTAKLFSRAGFEIVVLDDLSTGTRESARWGTFVVGDIADTKLVRRILRDHAVSTVLHLAARTNARESVRMPEAYLAINVCGSLALLDSMVSAGVKRIVFASSCAVYGESASPIARETSLCAPISPYGESKVAIERALAFYAEAHGVFWTALRYFNVAGAADGLSCDSAKSSRIIPRVARWAFGQATPPEVFGTTFPTTDGSAVRDYVHVEDIAAANLSAVRGLAEGRSGEAINIGSESGVSVFDIINSVSHAAGAKPSFVERKAWQGDPAHIVSDSSKAHDILGWRTLQSTLPEIVSSVIRSVSEEHVVSEPISGSS